MEKLKNGKEKWKSFSISVRWSIYIINSVDKPNLLDQTSYNPTSHKATTVRTLTRRAQIVCDSDDISTDEIKHLNTVYIKNTYSTDFIERNVKNWRLKSKNANGSLRTLKNTIQLPKVTWRMPFPFIVVEVDTRNVTAR